MRPLAAYCCLGLVLWGLISATSSQGFNPKLESISRTELLRDGRHSSDHVRHTTRQLQSTISNGRIAEGTTPDSSANTTDRPHSQSRGSPSSSRGEKSVRKLEIVIAHYEQWNADRVRTFWLSFIDIPKIKELDPYVYFYCQNDGLMEENVREMMGPLMDRGEVVKLVNKGRESRVYLHYMLHHYDKLPLHTLFSQDVVGEPWIPDPPFLRRVENLFTPETGILPLAEIWAEVCDDRKWVDTTGQETHLTYETYALITGRYCPAEGFVSFGKGQFIVSRARILGQPKELYKEMLEMIEADRDHWIHGRHNADWYKDPAGPYIGHVYERTWTLLFDCYKGGQDFLERCNKCDEQRSQNCEPGDCQCRDEVHSTERTASIKIKVKHKQTEA